MALRVSGAARARTVVMTEPITTPRIVYPAQPPRLRAPGGHHVRHPGEPGGGGPAGDNGLRKTTPAAQTCLELGLGKRS
ncbi:hypothetical protein QJS66_00010 [Kocuria rhizophila]|nr:hypothetical protein QJS66_00010 [Kocuria rhizophila]